METTEPTCQELKNKISELEAKLAETQWLHDKENISEKEPYMPFYGDVTELNTERTILDNVGKENLNALTSELMDLLDTSVAIYEKNGDYAYGVFNSGWCQLLDASSRMLCNTDDNETALNCGKWFCHDDCWNNSAKTAIISKKSTDIDCPGGMRLFAEPIFTGNKVIGVINIGYGKPPSDDKTLKEIADKYSIGFESLKQKALAYNPRPDFIIEIAKKRLKSIAQLIGEIVQRKQSEQELKERVKELDCISQFSKLAVKKNNIDDILNELTYLLKKSFSVPGITEVRIENDGITYQTDNFRETPFLLQSDIIVEQKKKGKIEIAILQDKTKKPVAFLKEEYKLLQVITERLNSTIERLKINKRYKLLSENISDGIVLIEDDKIKYVSPAYARLLGQNLQELKQIKLDEIFSFIHPDDTERIRKKVYEAHKNQVKNYRYEYRAQKANGEYIWIEDALNSEYDENGNRIRTIIRARDITDRKKTEQTLQENEERYQKVEQIAHIGNWEMEINTGKSYWSDEFFRICGFEAQSFTPTSEKGFEVIHPDDRERAAEVIQESISSGKPYDIQKRIVRPNGEIRWVHSEGNIIYDDNNQASKLIGYFLDITKRTEAKQALKEYSQQLEEANATKDRFISILGHDLRSPFNTLLGFSNLLTKKIDKYDKEQIQTFASTIHSTAEHTYNLLINLLEWSKSQRDKIPFNPQNTNLYYLVQEPFLLVNESAEAKQIQLVMDIPKETETVVDSEMMKTVIRNLLSNAVKYTPENGKITISAKPVNNKMIIEISDTGIGMDEKTKNSLFRIDETQSKRGTKGERGTGLGLLLCKEFVEKHNGSIHVESEPGEGSTFIVSLPVEQEMNN